MLGMVEQEDPETGEIILVPAPDPGLAGEDAPGNGGLEVSRFAQLLESTRQLELDAEQLELDGDEVSRRESDDFKSALAAAEAARLQAEDRAREAEARAREAEVQRALAEAQNAILAAQEREAEAWKRFQEAEGQGHAGVAEPEPQAGRSFLELLAGAGEAPPNATEAQPKEEASAELNWQQRMLMPQESNGEVNGTGRRYGTKGMTNGRQKAHGDEEDDGSLHMTGVEGEQDEEELNWQQQMLLQNPPEAPPIPRDGKIGWKHDAPIQGPGSGFVPEWKRQLDLAADSGEFVDDQEQDAETKKLPANKATDFLSMLARQSNAFDEHERPDDAETCEENWKKWAEKEERRRPRTDRPPPQQGFRSAGGFNQQHQQLGFQPVFHPGQQQAVPYQVDAYYPAPTPMVPQHGGRGGRGGRGHPPRQHQQQQHMSRMQMQQMQFNPQMQFNLHANPQFSMYQGESQPQYHRNQHQHQQQGRGFHSPQTEAMPTSFVSGGFHQYQF